MTQGKTPCPPCKARRRLLLAAAASPAFAGPAARALAGPSGEPVLTISGRLKHANHGTQAIFDMPMLTSLPQVSLVAKTPWYNEAHTFTGPLMRDVLLHCGAQGNVLRLTALNDFRAEMPMTDVSRHDVIIARLLDGKAMAVREKGPLFVMYPFNAKPELRSTVYYTRAVWQLRWVEML